MASPPSYAIEQFTETARVYPDWRVVKVEKTRPRLYSRGCHLQTLARCQRVVGLA